MRLLLAIAVCIFTGSTVSGQHLRLLGETTRTHERLNDAAELERQQRDLEALEQYLKLIADVPDEWVQVFNGQLLRSCRQVVLGRIAANPRMREAFRSRFEQSATAAVSRAIDRKDLDELNRLVAANWPTQATAKALDAAGDLAFERGDMAGAIHNWRQLAGPQRSGEPIFPDSANEAAAARTKSMLAGKLLGETAKAENRERLPMASKVDATSLADNLASLPRIEPSAIRTFGTNEHRIGANSLRMTNLAPRRVLPSIDWPTCELSTDDSLPERNPIASPRQLKAHPLFWSGKLIVNDGERIFAINPYSGLVDDFFGRPGRRETPMNEPQTLASDENRVFATLNNDTIVCLSRDATFETWKWKKLWELSVSTSADRTKFQGCPIVANGRLYVAAMTTTANRATLNIRCYSTEQPNDSPIWTNTLAEIQVDSQFRSSYMPPLTIAGPNLICSTEAGMVIALDARTGKPAWAAKYPSRGPRGLPANLLPVPRDLCPPVYINGRVFVAPADYDQVLAFDAHTGIPLWDRPPVLEVVHMLGVVGDKLVVTADGTYHGIGAINVTNGKIDPHWGKLDAAAPFGRGLILRDYVLFPTRFNGLLVLDRGGRPVYPPTLFHNLTGGNLVYDDGTLVIATANHLIRLDYTEVSEKNKSTPR